MTRRDEVRGKLLAERKRLESAIDRLSAYQCLDLEDQITLECLEHGMDEVNFALERLAAGAYGFCEVCGALIPEERLRAVVTASMCIACASERERCYRPGRRSVPLQPASS